ncbi:MAG: PIG-L family deacetylase [Candidatus Aminicenantes bacterium]|nr:PIG-L family deacetylase [Candidatus Aminicenantes bacterium]
MKFFKPDAAVFVPDGLAAEDAFRRVTHLGIGAHQDDLEIMAFHGIQKCFGSRELWFGGVTCTDGAGSPRAGEYASFTDADMAALRRREQEKAAVLGNYGVLAQLNYASAEIKDVGTGRLKADLVKVLKAARPEVVYTHNPADKHDTHLAVVFTALAALRELEPDERPTTVYGCEVWRGLDWMDDADKVPLDVSRRENLSLGLIGVYDSQVEGGKRYDLATAGRRRANAVYFQSHATDEAEQLWFAMDLTPLVRDDSIDVGRYVLGHLDKFRASVEAKIKKYWIRKR